MLRKRNDIKSCKRCGETCFGNVCRSCFEDTRGMGVSLMIKKRNERLGVYGKGVVL